MIPFILNNEDIATDLPAGTTVLDFVRYRKNLKGTKIGCREGDCGACTILVGELKDSRVAYRTMTSCLMPLANAAGKHIVTVEGINPQNGSLTPVQQAMVDESGTQCGFCTVGFVMSLTGFCIDDSEKTSEMAVSSIDGNICRCTGYKSIERAAEIVRRQLAEGGRQFVPEYFDTVYARLAKMRDATILTETRTAAVISNIVAGGTDVYVQKPDALPETKSSHVFYDDTLRGISDDGSFVEIGASTTVTDLLESPDMRSIFPDLYKHLKLVSSTPIRNMATLAGNFVNASPIGDMTVWFLALDADIIFNNGREMPLRKLYIDYKKLAKTDQEFIQTIRFRKPLEDFRFNFEKVCKRTYLDIASVNTAISLTVESTPGPGWIPPALSISDLGFGIADLDEADHKIRNPKSQIPYQQNRVDYKILSAHVSCGGVAPIPLYLKETSEFLRGQQLNAQTIADANEIMQAEISPISDVRGSADYKRLLLRQLFRAHFVELFDFDSTAAA
ncbi:MAG: FAD binding domain-containing protein [Pyrinomonadaceae bacterium]